MSKHTYVMRVQTITTHRVEAESYDEAEQLATGQAFRCVFEGMEQPRVVGSEAGGEEASQ